MQCLKQDLKNVTWPKNIIKLKLFLQALPRREEEEDEDPPPPPPLTGLVWNSEKYHGSPLSLSDERLGSLASWVEKHNITTVKLDCRIKGGWNISALLYHKDPTQDTLRPPLGISFALAVSLWHTWKGNRVYYRRSCAIKTQHKTRNIPRVAWAVSLWHERAGVNQSDCRRVERTSTPALSGWPGTGETTTPHWGTGPGTWRSS